MVFRFRIFYFIFTPLGLERWLASVLYLLISLIAVILFNIFLFFILYFPIFVDVIFISFYWVEFARAHFWWLAMARYILFHSTCVCVSCASVFGVASMFFVAWFSLRSRRRLRAQPIARQPNQRQTVLAQFHNNRRFIHFTQQPRTMYSRRLCFYFLQDKNKVKTQYLPQIEKDVF